MRYLSVCSGIEAATVAWHPLGWEPVAFSEIEAFPSAVLAHHYPSVPNWGDMTKFEEWPNANVDLLVGGTPCQSFSLAGLRAGLADPRGNLMLTYLAIARRYRPKWLVWENVPGVLSSGGGRDFASLLRGLDELGYGWAYRVLDAQYFGVAQRRRRVFVVGYLGDWRRAAAVLFERHSLSGHPAPSREARKDVSDTTGFSVVGSLTSGYGSKLGTDESCQGSVIPVAHTLRATHNAGEDGTGRGTPIVPVAFDTYNQSTSDTSIPVRVGNMKDSLPAAFVGMQVRRLTPRECERLQGCPDDYTLIPYRNKPAADGPRYKALGNSMAVPVMSWIGRRIALVESHVA